MNDLLATYARCIRNLDDPIDEVDEEVCVFSVLNARDVLAAGKLTLDEQRELARLDKELRARSDVLVRFLPGPNPPDRTHWWWWLHEG